MGYEKNEICFYIKKDIAGKEGDDILSITQKGIKIKDISSNEGQLAESYSNYQLIAKKEELLADLESYKKSLIYEYVTGKKGVTL